MGLISSVCVNQSGAHEWSSVPEVALRCPLSRGNSNATIRLQRCIAAFRSVAWRSCEWVVARYFYCVGREEAQHERSSGQRKLQHLTSASDLDKIRNIVAAKSINYSKY